MHPASTTTKRLEKEQEPASGWWGEKLWGCKRELVKHKQTMRSKAGLSLHLQPPSLNFTPHESLDSSICKLSWTLMCFFFFPFPVLHSQKVISAAPGVWKEAPAAVFTLHLAASTEPWLCQLDLHTGGSLSHPVKRSGGLGFLLVTHSTTMKHVPSCTIYTHFCI